MMWPPSILYLQITRESRSSLKLWIPLFLIWPVLLVMGVLIFPLFALGVGLAGRRGGRRAIIMAGPAIFGLFCASRGLRIEATEQGQGFVLALN